MVLGNQESLQRFEWKALLVLGLRFNGQYNNSGQCHDDYSNHGPMCEEIGHFLRKHLRALADPRTPPTDYHFGN